LHVSIDFTPDLTVFWLFLFHILAAGVQPFFWISGDD
jgi:hypothetical protein